MSGAAASSDWNPGAYHRFRGLRLRPAVDLLKAIGPLPEGAVVDLGCGSGAAGDMLVALERDVIGVDASPAMLDAARASGHYAGLVEGDIATWQADHAPALIYSNAALHWLGDHEMLLPKLAAMLAKGGTLAVQMPHQNNAPSHRVWASLCEEMFPGRVDHAAGPGVLNAARYYRMLAPLGQVSLWETEYFQNLEASDSAHPVRLFTEATYARPILEALEPAERESLITAYEAVMEKAYPRSNDGTVLFPFRRMFFTLVVA